MSYVSSDCVCFFSTFYCSMWYCNFNGNAICIIDDDSWVKYIYFSFFFRFSIRRKCDRTAIRLFDRIFHRIAYRIKTYKCATLKSHPFNSVTMNTRAACAHVHINFQLHNILLQKYPWINECISNQSSFSLSHKFSYLIRYFVALRILSLSRLGRGFTIKFVCVSMICSMRIFSSNEMPLKIEIVYLVCVCVGWIDRWCRLHLANLKWLCAQWHIYLYRHLASHLSIV